jgi:hypothetical protein
MRHPEVKYAGIGMKGIKSSGGLTGVRETQDFITAVAEKFSNKCDDFRLVVDDKYS